MNDASNFPESEQPEAETTSAQAGTETTSAQAEGTENTSAQAETAANGTGSAQGRVCPQCGAALEPGDGSEDVTYHIVRPEAERSYEDANFHPSDDAGNTPPRYYTPNDDAWAEKPKHKHRPRKPRTARTPEQKRLITRIACLCLVCALLGGRPHELTTDLTISAGAPSDVASRAADAYANGFPILKIKLGTDIEADLQTLRELKAALPPDACLRLLFLPS